MSPRIRVALVAIAALLIGGTGGGVAGAYVASYFLGDFFGNASLLRSAVDAQMRVAVLQHVRDGQLSKAADLLETQLDSDIIGLQVNGKLPSETNNIVKKAIAKAKIYRANFPHKSGFPEVDSGVSSVLSQHVESSGQP